MSQSTPSHNLNALVRWGCLVHREIVGALTQLLFLILVGRLLILQKSKLK